ncbi:MAG: hypothetical protein QNJ55_15835 [Xenococcus sp. MO_188.B8]|nr:hypothetical protein [Xenococcus sp. MO_188.B8]
MDKIYIDPQLKSKFSYLIDHYDLSDIVYLLDQYIEGRTKVAFELETENAPYWNNASGYCRIMSRELEQMKTVYNVGYGVSYYAPNSYINDFYNQIIKVS